MRTGLSRNTRGFHVLFIASLIAAPGCAHRDELPLSPGHIGVEAPAVAPPPVQNIPPTVRVPFHVPPPKPQTKQQTFSIVVHETPVKDLLFALARDSKLNVDVHPNIQGLVTLNALNETLPAILDRIKKQVNLRYTLDGSRLSIVPDTPFVQTYRVDYVNIARNTTSSIGVSGQVATSIVSDNTAANAQASGNSSNTAINSTSNNDFWAVLAANIRMLLRSTNAVTATAEERSSRIEAARAAREEKIAQAEAVSRAGSGAPALFSSAFSQPASVDGSDDAVVVNAIAGTVSVLATERQQALVKKYLDEVADSAQRQVLIEATIVEVRLNDQYQAGVDWSRLAAEGATGFSIAQSTLRGRISTPPNFTIGYSNKNSDRTISAAIRLLESFGTTRVLSSPKLMTLNNQTALLKVVDQRVYFTLRLDVRDGVSVNSATRSVFTSQIHTVPVGMVMAVTPQIGADHAVTLNVRPSVSRITGFVSDPAPALNRQQLLGNNSTVPVSENLIPEVQVREMESVLQVQSGQTVVLGGLMQNEARRQRDGIPVLSRIPDVGDVFSTRDENASKTELVIFLRPTVITNASLASEELRMFQQFLPAAGSDAASVNK